MARNLITPLLLTGALALAACSDTAAEPTSPAPSKPVGTVDWADPTSVVRFDDGWSVRACEGDAPLLCVEKDGAVVGVVEAAAYELASFPDLDPTAGVDANLRAVAAGFVDTFRADRAAGCGADYRVEPVEPASFRLGGAEGLAFGFAGTRADGQPSEMSLQYATIANGRIVSIAAVAYDEGGCPGRDDLSSFDSATLAEFRPMLETVLTSIPLPVI